MTWTYFIYGYVLVPSLALAYIALAAWIAYRVAKHFTSIIARVGAGCAIAIALLLIPFADVIVGRIKFDRLCEQEAGFKVFRVVQLDSKYLRPDGRPKIEWSEERRDYEIGGIYAIDHSSEEVFNWPRIEKSVAVIRNKENGEVLGQRVNFRYWGGWLTWRLPGHKSADSCKQVRETRTSIEYEVFGTK